VWLSHVKRVKIFKKRLVGVAEFSEYFNWGFFGTCPIWEKRGGRWTKFRYRERD
jgi:hypothetical protein